MCGIAGIINLQENSSLNFFIKQLADKLVTRGVDDEGILFFNNTNNITNTKLEDYSEKCKGVFGHKRLSIIDISSNGKQPLSFDNEKYWITYNGEIYNYIELRNQLLNKGYNFCTNTDTEVLLASYKEWGVDCVSKFNGMWAFCIYDSYKNILFGSRDRFGVKPLYYYKSDKHFVFASEQKALVNCDLVKTAINAETAFDFLLTGECERYSEGLFKNIFELQPSNNFTLNLKNNDFKVWKYYELQTNTSNEKYRPIKFKEYKEKTSELIENAIKLRLRADVPIGTLLSGGIDSSTILGCCKYLNYKPLKSFTTSYNHAIDESSWAKIAADYNGAEWHSIEVKSEDFIRDFAKITEIQNLPLYSTSIYSHYKAVELAKSHNNKVLLNGFGGDELFGGYDEYKAIQEKFSNKLWYKLLLKNKLQNLLQSPIKKYLNEQFINSYNLINPKFYSTVNEQMLFDFTKNRLKNYLQAEDRNCMALSIENRNPFADDLPLIEYVFNIPSSYKIYKGISKHLMRESVKNVLPPAIYSRSDKQGFISPHNEWMQDIKAKFFDSLTNLSLQEYFNIEALKNDKEKILTNKSAKFNIHFFRLLSFAQWQKCFFE